MDEVRNIGAKGMVVHVGFDVADASGAATLEIRRMQGLGVPVSKLIIQEGMNENDTIIYAYH